MTIVQRDAHWHCCWSYCHIVLGPMRLIGYSVISVTNYHFTLCKIPEESRSHLHHSGNLKSCLVFTYVIDCCDLALHSHYVFQFFSQSLSRCVKKLRRYWLSLSLDCQKKVLVATFIKFRIVQCFLLVAITAVSSC